MVDNASPSQNFTPVVVGAARTAEAVIREYYDRFNERRFVEAAALFTEDVQLEQLPFLRQERGGIGYLQFVSAWIRAFPDAVFTPGASSRAGVMPTRFR
jgi:hypothetical protein